MESESLVRKGEMQYVGLPTQKEIKERRGTGWTSTMLHILTSLFSFMRFRHFLQSSRKSERTRTVEKDGVRCPQRDGKA